MYMNTITAFATTISSLHYSVFTAGKSGFNIDNYSANLAVDNPNISGYTNPTTKQVYFGSISKFLQNPDVRAKMIIPESVYREFNFENLIYIKSEKLTGYFFVRSIVNYVDGNTPCEVNLNML